MGVPRPRLSCIPGPLTPPRPGSWSPGQNSGPMTLKLPVAGVQCSAAGAGEGVLAGETRGGPKERRRPPTRVQQGKLAVRIPVTCCRCLSLHTLVHRAYTRLYLLPSSAVQEQRLPAECTGTRCALATPVPSDPTTLPFQSQFGQPLPSLATAARAPARSSPPIASNLQKQASPAMPPR